MLKKIMILGRPNVGKSSLFNAMIGKQKAIVNDYHGLTRDLNKQNFFINEAYYQIIDSPGIRDFGLEQISRTDVEQGFIDIREFSDQCRFHDCRHRQEPGCAVIDAVQKGKLSKRRLESFYRILDTLSGGNA